MQERLIRYVIIFVIGITSVLPTLWGTFVFDDGEAILKNSLVTSPDKEPIAKLFNHDFWGVELIHPRSHKSFRPFTTLTYRFGYAVWGNNPFPFHLQNLLLHGINCCLVYIFLEKCLGSCYSLIVKSKRSQYHGHSIVFWASVIFAVHPVHVEPLGGLVGRADLISSLVFLLGFVLIPSDHWSSSILTAVCSIFGSLFKENVIILSVFSVAFDILVKHNGMLSKKRLFHYFVSMIITVAYVFWRLKFQNGSPVFQYYDNPPAFAENIFTKISSILYVWSINAFTLLNPIWLCYDWSGNCVKLVESIYDFRFALTVGFLCVCSGLLYRSFKHHVLLIAGIISAITFLPSSNLIFVVGFVLAERNLYLPSIGSSLLVAYCFIEKGHLKFLVYLIVIFYIRSVQRSFEWIDQPALFKSGLKVCPDNAKVHYNLGTMYTESGNIADAEFAYKSAISLRDDYYQAMNNLGNLIRENNPTEAEYWLRKALELKLDFAAAWMNLGIVLSKKNKSEAFICYQNALKFRKFYPDCEYNLGNLYLDMGDQESALKSWEKAVSLIPHHEQSWINSVILHEQNGDLKRAKKVGLKALKLLHNCDTLHFIMGNILGKLAEYKVGRFHFETAIQICQDSGKRVPVKYFTNLGVLYHRWNKKALAKKAYLQALEIDPLSESAQKNLVLLKNSQDDKRSE